ncbi:MAG: magnesium/cobalt transporter CorA [Gammaproteobacteria bacterium]
MTEESAAPLADVLDSLGDGQVNWLHFDAPPDPPVLRLLQERLGLDALALEDVHNGGQRSKLELFENHSFVVVSVPLLHDGTVKVEQLSLFLGPRWVISVWPGPPSLLAPVLERLRSGGTGRIRTRGADYLLYTLVDAAVDSVFPVLETIAREVEDTEDEVLNGASEDTLAGIHHTRRNIIALRRLNVPGQEMLGALLRADDSPLGAQTRRYMRDVLDHHMRISDMMESLSEMIRGMHELNLATLSNRMNDVMKLLTMIATIFIPLSFVTGLYGMNFNPEVSPWNMPELNTRFGYPAVLLLLAGVAGIMIWAFRRRDWL